MSSRKYRQRGYMEDNGEKPRGRRPAGRPPRRQGPRGRGLGAPTTEAFRCAACGRPARAPGTDEFAAACPACGADLHSCTNCRHFDSSAPRECRKPVPERIAAKSKRNECEHYEPKVTLESGSDGGRPADPKAAFDALFKL